MNLNDIRKEIDSTDNQIAELIHKRMEIIKKVAEYKKQTGTGVADKKREREILDRICKEESDDYLRLVFLTIFDASRSYQSYLMGNKNELSERITKALEETPQLFPRKATVACQGVEGAFSQQACNRLFPIANIMYFSDFDLVFKAVESGMCAYGLLPLENSSYGSVGEVYDLMRTKNFNIVRSIRLHIHHALLAKKGVKLDEVTEVLSIDPALGQCGEFLRNLKNVKITTFPNTAAAAEYVSKSPDRGVAAVCSPSCADYYGLDVLKDGIQDSDNNYTRFICISKKPEIYPGSNRISLMLSLPHEPGSLYRLVGRFASLGLNLNKLESRTISGKDFSFMFYFDFEGSVVDERVKALLADLSESNHSFVFLGNYLEVN
ncbi:MAG: chorismate mutase [Oscillospiraceae bacterium]|nr:chorismate mutase [Oscillospiraceae bacterium]